MQGGAPGAGYGFPRIYVAGAGGMLGAAVVDVCAAEVDRRGQRPGASRGLAGPGGRRRPGRVRARGREFRPDLLINLAAFTDLEFCELNPRRPGPPTPWAPRTAAASPSDTTSPTSTSPPRASSAARRSGTTTRTSPNPLTVYAKIEAPRRASSSSRTIEQALRPAARLDDGRRTRPGQEVRQQDLSTDQGRGHRRSLRSPTCSAARPTPTTSHAVCSGGRERLVRHLQHGLQRHASRYDVARAFIECLGLEDEVEVVPVTSDFFAKTYFANRPASEQLDQLTAAGAWPGSDAALA